EGQQYGLQCRVAAQADDDAPPIAPDGGAIAGEEVLLDANELAGESKFFSLGALSVSPDGLRLAYSTDFDGDERVPLRVKEPTTGGPGPGESPNKVSRA